MTTMRTTALALAAIGVCLSFTACASNKTASADPKDRPRHHRR